MWKYANLRRVSFYNLSCIQAFSHAFVLLSSTASYVSVPTKNLDLMLNSHKLLFDESYPGFPVFPDSLILIKPM